MAGIHLLQDQAPVVLPMLSLMEAVTDFCEEILKAAVLAYERRKAFIEYLATAREVKHHLVRNDVVRPCPMPSWDPAKDPL